VDMDEKFFPQCRKCGLPMGEMTLTEFAACCLADGLPGLCFDCDPDSAATVPGLFWLWREGESFTIGDTDFEVWALPGNASELVQSHAHESERARGLSSYTYLNRIEENGALDANGIELKICPRCKGFDTIHVHPEKEACGECGGLGLVPAAIVLPVWVLGLGGEHV